MCSRKKVSDPLYSGRKPLALRAPNQVKTFPAFLITKVFNILEVSISAKWPLGKLEELGGQRIAFPWVPLSQVMLSLMGSWVLGVSGYNWSDGG